MAHESFIFKSEFEIPMDVIRKIPDLLYLFRPQGEWLVTNKTIKYYYPNYFFFIEGELGDIFSKGLITNNMIDVFNWMCDNMTLEVDCWNANDNDFGPSNIGCFKDEILSVARDYPDTPIKKTLIDVGINFALMMLNIKENSMYIFIGGHEIHYKLDKKTSYVSRYNVSVRDGVVEYNCSFEDDCEDSDLHTEYIFLNDTEYFKTLSSEEESNLRSLILSCDDIEVINYFDC